MGCTLAWPIGQTARVSEIDRSALVEAGRRMGIKAATASAMVDRLRNAVTKESGSLYETTERAHQQLGSKQPSLKPTLAGELRCLRAITKVIIADQATRLA